MWCLLIQNIIDLLDNFGDSDFDFLQTFGSNTTDSNFCGRDSVLLRFDPLLAKPVLQTQQPTSRFSKIPEEDEKPLDKNIQHTAKEEEAKKSESTTSETIDEFPQLIPLDKTMSVEIMKDIVTENEKEINNFECEDVKIRFGGIKYLSAISNLLYMHL